MADEQPPNPEGIVPGKPPPLPTEVSLTSPQPGMLSASGTRPAPPPLEDEQFSEFELFLRWLVGVALLLVFGWGFILIFALLSRRFEIFRLESATAISVPLSFVFIFLLEKDLWLSRFMGLRLGPHSSQVKETLFFWLFGVAGLLLRSTAGEKPSQPAANETDGTREIVETVVFVVVLVLLLKTFLAEAFVIPTGSMADTLLGYHKQFTCKQCGYRFLVNCSGEVDPQKGQRPQIVIGGVCPNCRFHNLLPREVREAEPRPQVEPPPRQELEPRPPGDQQ